MEGTDYEQWLARAQSLAENIQMGNDDAVNRIIDEISRARESMLFQELGKLTREFHEALNGFRLDARITHLAQENIPDAKQRLNYVIVMTEQAANRTLTAVEEVMPVCEKLGAQSKDLHERWEKFTHRHMTAAAFRDLSKDVGSFLESAPTDAEKIRTNLSDVLMAQDYQDITGQILQRVIRLVNEMEEHLVRLVTGSGLRTREVAPPATPQAAVATAAASDTVAVHGPHIPGSAPEEEVVHSQDDVDALLSSLGF